MTRGTHRRTGAGPIVSEVRRLRAELARVTAERDQLAGLLTVRAVALDEDGARLVGGICYQAGLEDGWREGYAAAERDQAAQWAVTRRLIHASVAPVLDPGGWAREQAADAARRIRAAEAGEHRDQAAHWAAFTARARNTADRDRTDVQRACVQLAPARARTAAA